MLRATLCAALAASLLSTSAAAQSATREKVLAALPGLKALAEQTVAKGEVPGLSIAVVHRDEVVYPRGLRRPPDRAAPTRSTPTRCSSSRRSPSRWPRPSSPGWWATARCRGTAASAISIPASRLHDAYPTAEVTIRDLFAHRSGLSGNVGNDIEELGFSQGEILPPSASGKAGLQLPRRLRLQQFRPHRGRGRRGARLGQGLGGGRRGKALQAARHDLDQLALPRFHRPSQPRRAARAGSTASGPRSRGATPTRNRRPAAQARARATLPSGCGSSSPRASWATGRSSTRRPSRRPIFRPA